MRRFSLALIFSFFIFYFSLAEAAIIPGQLVVKFKPGVISLPKGLSAAAIGAAAVSVSSIRSLNEQYGVTELHQIYVDALAIRPDWTHLRDDYLLIFPTNQPVAQAAAAFQADPNVVSATPNTIVRAFDTTPNDEFYSSQWGLSKISAPSAWDRTTGTSEVMMAILDTGLNYNHEEFSGRVDLTHAKDYVNDDNEPLDDFGHGTAVTGVAAATGNNTKGITGMDWKAKILPVKVLDSGGSGTITNVNKGLAYLAALKSTGEALVAINLSLGQYDPDSNLEARCNEAFNQGLVLVGAAGNGGVERLTYPAYYPSVFAVAATDSSDKKSVWTGLDTETGQTKASNWGTWVDVSAPGSAILSTDKSGSYSSGWNGTSLATPYVCGLATLIKALYPSLTNTQIMDRIKNNVDNIDAQNAAYLGKLGSGRVNAYLALVGLSAIITTPASGEYISGTKVVRGTASGLNFSNYRLEALKGSEITTIETSTASVESGSLGSWNTSGLNGEYLLRLRVFSGENITREAGATVFVDNTSPEASLSSPVNGATIEGRVTIFGQAKDVYFDRYSLAYGTGESPVNFENIGTFYSSVAGGILGTWETTGLRGSHVLRLSAYDRVGAAAVASVKVSISDAPPTKEAQAVSSSLPLTFALPNPFDRASTAETAFVYSLQGNFDTSVYLFDLSGNLIWRKSYGAGENGGKAGVNAPAWDGEDRYGQRAANGVYIYQVTADRKVIARGKIIVLN